MLVKSSRYKYLVRVEVGVGLAQAVQERLRVSAQRLSRREKVRAADVQANPFGRAASGRLQSLPGKKCGTPPTIRAARVRALLRHPSSGSRCLAVD